MINEGKNFPVIIVTIKLLKRFLEDVILDPNMQNFLVSNVTLLTHGREALTITFKKFMKALGILVSYVNLKHLQNGS